MKARMPASERVPGHRLDCYTHGPSAVNDRTVQTQAARDGRCRQSVLRRRIVVCYTFPMTSASVFNNPDALPQLIGEFRPVDEWQAHINNIFYGLRGGRLREFYQTFSAADYRLAHALAADYYDRVQKRDKAKRKQAETNAPTGRLIIHEWGCGHGNLAACFLTHLKALDRDGLVYPRVRYVLVDKQEAGLHAARAHPDPGPA